MSRIDSTGSRKLPEYKPERLSELGPERNNHHSTFSEGLGDLMLPFLIGAACIVGSIWIVINAELFLHRAERATGIVLEAHQSACEYCEAWIKVEFSDSAGVVHQATSETGGETTSIKAGDTIEVLYDPNDPSDMRGPRLRFASWFDASMLFGFGVWLLFKLPPAVRARPRRTEIVCQTDQSLSSSV
jgi:hypothetical protein